MTRKCQEKSSWKGPLNNVKVLDFTRVLSGPYATMMLADQGAEVIKVETPGKGDDTRNFPPFQGDMSHYYMSLNRNKKSITLNLATEEGKMIARDLAAKSDVVIENFRPGVMERLGLDYATLAEHNPGLVYCSISGFGADGPLRDQPSFDIVAQALSGVMSVNGEPGARPTKMGLPIGDMAGGIYGSIAILSALYERKETGKGRLIDISMLDSLLGMLGYLAQIYLVTGESPKPQGTRHPNLVPYGAFKTSDGYIIIACLTEGFWHNLARAIGDEELIEDSRFADYASRLTYRDELNELVERHTRTCTTAEWTERLQRYDVPHSPILSIGEALEHENTRARNMINSVYHPVMGELRLVGNPIHYMGMPRPSLEPPPLLGENTEEILKDILHLDVEQIAELRDRGVFNPLGTLKVAERTC
ncbi:CoA transferase [Halomonas sp. Bachu 37]|uniref:CaiB/BaiF CoA transferase family protein n=1 Tax=Halomonas kashgarensis TaxID=3084920 RepID=UPI003216936B